MPRKPARTPSPGEQHILKLFADSIKDDSKDWSVLREVDFGELLALLVASDSAVMLRAANQRSGLAIGLYVGGQNAWVTASDPHEAVIALNQIIGNLEKLAGDRKAPTPTQKGRAARKSL